ncbi:helix-turn-helix transcriptional regulator [Urbifossiella limnaea]|uniref:Helix-turn-helix domain protein n=1 Tax=Urbifossiella limnaea TaxID=2528023 RepID=A0A517Y1I3_9BACT|nr:helix-turn-helix domain-containing protein [Urbifossiella limnaea]QDU23583.1 Helix-turn-helix domain protein [Urbifossiella limnaea]
MTTTPLPDPVALLSVDDVAALLGVSPRTVWRLRDGGHLPPPVRVGSLVRWRRATLLMWLDEATEPRRDGRKGGRTND